MESAVPRWQEDSLLAFCQPEGGMLVFVEEEGVSQTKIRRERKGPEGYRCCVAPALYTVKDTKQKIWRKVNPSLTL